MILDRLIELIIFFPVYVVFTQFAERKWLADAQTRVGPKLVGASGFLQSASDFLKTINQRNYQSFGLKRGISVVLYAALVGSMLYLLPTNQIAVSGENEYSAILFFVVLVFTHFVRAVMSWSVIERDSYIKLSKGIIVQTASFFVLLITLLSSALRAGSFKWADIVSRQAESLFGLGFFSFFPFGMIETICFSVSGMALFGIRPLFVLQFADRSGGVDESLNRMIQSFSSYLFAVVLVALYFGGWNIPFGLEKGLSDSSREIFQTLWVLTKALIVSAVIKVLLQSVSKMDSDQQLALFWKYVAPGAVLALLGTGVCQWMTQ